MYDKLQKNPALLPFSVFIKHFYRMDLAPKRNNKILIISLLTCNLGKLSLQYRIFLKEKYGKS